MTNEQRHIYWDQASVLVQLGLLDPSRLPAVGAEMAAKHLALVREHPTTS